VLNQPALAGAMIFCACRSGKKIGSIKPFQQLGRAFPRNVLSINLLKLLFVIQIAAPLL